MLHTTVKSRLWQSLTAIGRQWISTSGRCLSQRSEERSGKREPAFPDPYEEEEEADRDHFEDEETEVMKEKVLTSALRFVPEHGWSKKALSSGAEAEGLTAMAHGMFPRGGADLALFFYASANQELANRMAAESEAVASGNKGEKSVRAFIRDALETRLRMLVPHLSTWPQAMALMSLPQNAPEALRHLATLTDDVWFYAGDRSHDMNWYSKRFSLAAVYKSSELCLLQDKTDNFEETWKFLDRRLVNLAEFGKLTRQLQQSAGMLGDFASSASILTLNLLGANNRHR